MIVFDKRGSGLSDRPHFFPDMDTRIDDLRAVLDAVGSERAALVAAQEGCWMASLERLATLGDAGWRELVGRHHELVRRTLNRYRGTEIDTAG